VDVILVGVEHMLATMAAVLAGDGVQVAFLEVG